MVINTLGCYYEDYYMGLAHLASTNSNCINKVGVIITNDNRIVTIGYNQVLYASREEFTEVCAIEKAILEIINIKDLVGESVIYTTCFPSKKCVEMIIENKINRIIYQGDCHDEQLHKMLCENGVTVEKYDNLKNKVLMIRK